MRANFTLSKDQKEILVGLLLGDGGLYKEGWATNYRLRIEQGDAQREYLFWKFMAFRNCCSAEPSYQKRNQSWRIRTLSHKAFNWHAAWFYQKGKKVVPYDIGRYLTPLSLAVWFMDDGAKGPGDTGYTLNTQSFSHDENERLREALRKEFSLKEVSLHRDKKWWRLYIRKGSATAFENVVNQYVIPSMRYKFHIFDPVETTRRPPLDAQSAI